MESKLELVINELRAFIVECLEKSVSYNQFSAGAEKIISQHRALNFDLISPVIYQALKIVNPKKRYLGPAEGDEGWLLGFASDLDRNLDELRALPDDANNRAQIHRYEKLQSELLQAASCLPIVPLESTTD